MQHARKRNVFESVMIKPERKSPVGIYRYIQKDNINMAIKN